MIIHHNHFYRFLLLHNGAQLLNIHLESAIAHKAAYRTVRIGKGGADGCRQTVAHGSQTTAGTQTALMVILKVTCCK